MASSSKVRQILSAHWRSVESGPFFKLEKLPSLVGDRLPHEYLAIIDEFGGREGFLGAEYLRLYRLGELIELNSAYDVPTYLPDAFVFGSDGCGEAYAFPFGESRVVRVPFMPLIAELCEDYAGSFEELIDRLAASGEATELNPDAVGKEVHDKHPIALGGSPTDEANKVLVPVAKHAEVCQFWNQVYRRMRSERDAQPGPRG